MVALTACSTSTDWQSGHMNDSTIERHSDALTATNGIAFNGIAFNGIAFNGIAFNGIAFNGIAFNGISLNGIAFNGIAFNGIAFNGIDAEQEANFTKLLEYTVECALPAEQSVTIYTSDGTPKVLAGAMGLAPEWQDGPLSAAGERKVSACLAARSNALEQTVALSIRHPDLSMEAVEEDVFTTHEGAFWGNLFASPASIQACLVDGGGLSGRVCAESDSCGFLIVGDCADVCGSYDPVNGYSHCGEDQSTAVINTFLNLGSRLSFGQDQLCKNDDGALSCWGGNRYGQLGDGTTEDRSEPVHVTQLGDQVAEAAIDSHACARQQDGDLLCWGRNDDGQVGDGSRVERHGPVHVAGDIASFAIGESHTCAVHTDSSLSCWGSNRHGQLGIGDQAGSQRGATSVPAPVPALATGVARLASSTSARHTCASTSDGAAFCWGANDRGQLGDGSRREQDTPVQVAVDEDGNAFGEVTDMCASRNLTCARKADGTMWCWGLDRATRPRHVASGAAPGGLACGEMHACFVRELDSTVWCFGANTHGQLGHDTARPFTMTPGQVAGVDAVSHVNAGRTQTCATRVDGSLLCWGRDPGSEAGISPLLPAALSSTPALVDLAPR